MAHCCCCRHYFTLVLSEMVGGLAFSYDLYVHTYVPFYINCICLFAALNNVTITQETLWCVATLRWWVMVSADGYWYVVFCCSTPLALLNGCVLAGWLAGRLLGWLSTLIGYDNRCRWQWTSSCGTVTTTNIYIPRGRQLQRPTTAQEPMTVANAANKMRHVATNFPKFFLPFSQPQFSLSTSFICLLLF